MSKAPKPFNNRHKRAQGNRDHARRRETPAPSDAEIEQRLNDLVKPAVFGEIAHYRQLGLRNRILTLPVMVAVVLALIWRQVPGVCTLQRMLARERVLWSEPVAVSQAALSERFLTFPAELFERILYTVLGQLAPRLATRSHPVPPHLQEVAPRFGGCYALDGTTLEALFRKLQALQEDPAARLAGHLLAVCDLFSHLPQRIWFAEDPQANDKSFFPPILSWLPPHSLVVFDLGFFAFPFFDALTAGGQWFVTRLRAKTSFSVERVLCERPQLRERLVHLGQYRSNPSQHTVRLIEVYVRGAWHQYLTNVLDPQRLSVIEVVALYEQRWQIEQAFLLVKRLLGLSYLWVGSLNGVQLQVWATWLYYAILIDLCDDVAQLLQLPLHRISVEMVSRSLYFYTVAVAQGYRGSAAAYFADPVNRDLGIVKRRRGGQLPLSTEVWLLLRDSP
jgi:Transposase DDE domain